MSNKRNDYEIDLSVAENAAKSKYKPPCDSVKLTMVTAKSSFMIHGIKLLVCHWLLCGACGSFFIILTQHGKLSRNIRVI